MEYLEKTQFDQESRLGDSWADEHSPVVEDWGTGSWRSTEATFTAPSLQREGLGDNRSWSMEHLERAQFDQESQVRLKDSVEEHAPFEDSFREA